MTFKVASIVPVWLLAIIGSILVGILSPSDEYYTWLAIVFAVATISTFCIQLFVRSKDGLVSRMMASIGGSLIILAIATGVLALISA